MVHVTRSIRTLGWVQAIALTLVSSSCKVYQASLIDSVGVATPDASASDSVIDDVKPDLANPSPEDDSPIAAGEPNDAGAPDDSTDAGAPQPPPPAHDPTPAMDASLPAATGDDRPPTLPDKPVTAPFDPLSCSGGECWWSHSPADGCKTTGVPRPEDRPDSAADGGNTSIADVYLGWTEMRLGETKLDGTRSDTAWQSFGLDLDGVCTNSASCPNVVDAQSCRAATPQIPFDGASCRDNTFASLQPVAAAVPEIGQRFGISESLFNCNLWRGTYNILLKVSGYNGAPNDSQVRLDIYLSPGLQRSQAWSCPLDNFNTTYPLWRAVAEWKIDPDSLTGPITQPGTLPESRMADANAYVKNGYLVASLPNEVLLRLEGDGKPHRGFALKAQKGIWVGNLVRGQDGTWRIRDGLAAGRIRSADLVQSFRQIGLCEGIGLDSFYSSVVSYIHDNADLLLDGQVDPSMPCDAMSVGIAFEAAQITPGAVGQAPPLVECCAPGVAFEDCNPKCGDGRLNGSEVCDTAIASGQPGACPTSCPALDACTPQALSGSECMAHCVPAPIRQVGVEDACCPSGADATSDSDCPSVCGNNVVEPGETCDPASSCGSCSVANACLIATPIGSAQTCTASCQLTPVTECKGGDGCCPSACNRSTDSDCSAACGDGILDPNETCETRGNDLCPTSCDDNDACTSDIQTGNAERCNVICTHSPIDAPQNGDGCCPAGSNANNDADCAPRCGNQQVETGEQCDDGNASGGDGCTAGCMVETAEQRCLALIGVDDACARCSCQKCQSTALSCYGASNAADVAACRTLVSCGLAAGCLSDACYCGSSGLGCALGLANGACRPQVEAAAKSSNLGDILARRDDSGYPLGRANQLAQCAANSCASECGLH
jgi:cysteine-rich repeat protein